MYTNGYPFINGGYPFLNGDPVVRKKIYALYTQFRVFEKVYKHISNRTPATFDQCEQSIRHLAQTNECAGSLGFRPSDKAKRGQHYLWARMITVNEIVTSRLVSTHAIFESPKIEERMKNQYLPMLTGSLPTVLSHLVLGYARDPYLCMTCLLPERLSSREMAFVRPEWKSFLDTQVEDADFWK